MHTPAIRCIESQLLLLEDSLQIPPFAKFIRPHDRYFMEIAAQAAGALQPPPATGITFVPWTERYHEDTARLVSAAYKGHVDSDINDQYRSIPGARQFLTNIVRYPGFGQFSAPASVLAIDGSSGRVCGACLCSLVSPHSGRVTQLCVLPALRGARIGYELVRQSLERLARVGCTIVSLTVTCANVDAIRLYDSIGFRVQHKFPALVWEHW